MSDLGKLLYFAVNTKEDLKMEYIPIITASLIFIGFVSLLVIAAKIMTIPVSQK